MTTELKELHEKNEKAIVMIANLIEKLDVFMPWEIELDKELSEIIEVLK